MRIQAGTIAPSFAARDSFGQPIDLEQYAGKWVLLSFFRNGACAICNLRVHRLIERFPDLQRQGLEVIAVFESPDLSIQEYVGQQAAPFPIVPDPDASLYALYGVEVSEDKVNATMTRPETPDVIAEAAANGFTLRREPGSNFYRLPAEFLIAPDGLVRIAHYGEYVYDHLEFDALERALAS